MSNIHTKFAMCALPVAMAGGVVAGVRGGPINALRPMRSCDVGIALGIRRTR